MFRKPTVTRLLAIKFLGLWGGNQINREKDDLIQEKQPANLKIEFAAAQTNAQKPVAIGYDRVIAASSERIIDLWLEKGIPGITISVSKRGKLVWNSSFGYCDVENQVKCSPDARMRIASISKALFSSTIVGPMIEQGKVDLDSSVHNYLTEDEFPKQKYNGEETDITIKQLLSHTSGIKHYTRYDDKPLRPIGSRGSQKVYQCDDQYDRRGFYQRNTYRGVIEALEPFKDGPLVGEPGKFKYTTYGFTLLSAVIEKIHQKSDKGSSDEQIEDFWIKKLRREWDMQETSLDQDEPILTRRARYYHRSGLNGHLVNAPYTDNSVKWAGGGIISTSNDLVKFGNALIDSYKGKSNSKLKPETVSLLWKEVTDSYALGFHLKEINTVEGEKRAIYHLGCALGGSSALIIYPESEIVVAILANMESVNLLPVSLYIADQFANNSQ